MMNLCVKIDKHADNIDDKFCIKNKSILRDQRKNKVNVKNPVRQI